jgi:hypothetical protein
MRFSVPKRARRGRPRWTLLKSVSLEAEPTKRRRLNPICSRCDSAALIKFGAHAVICVGFFLEMSGWAKAMGFLALKPTFALRPPVQAQSAIVCGSRQAQRRRHVCEGGQYAPRANRTGAAKKLAVLHTVAPFCSGRLHQDDPPLLGNIDIGWVFIEILRGRGPSPSNSDDQLQPRTALGPQMGTSARRQFAVDSPGTGSLRLDSAASGG